MGEKIKKEINQEGYKETPIGKIPEDWETTKIRDIGEVKDGDWILKKYYEDDGVRLLQVSDIGKGSFANNSNRFISNENAKELGCNFIKQGKDILISRMPDPIGRACISPKLPYDYIVAVDVSILSPYTDEWNENFIIQLLNFKPTLYRMEKMASGATRNRISRTNLEKILLQKPPLSEQKKIAGILSTVDESIEKVDKAIEKTKRLKKGMMQELLTKGIGHKKFKETPIGKIPEDWEVKKLENIADRFISGGTPSTKVSEYWGGRIPWIRSVHLEGNLIKESEEYITIKGLENSSTNVIPKGNIIIGTRVGIGKVAVNSIDLAINQDLTGILLKKSIVEPKFLAWFFNSPGVINRINSFSRGTTIKGITQTNLRNMLVPIPTLIEQKKIAKILFTIDEKKDLEEERKERLTRIKKGLMQDLLTGRKRVKIGR